LLEDNLWNRDLTLFAQFCGFHKSRIPYFRYSGTPEDDLGLGPTRGVN
jgi:hypothetical protein